MFPGISGERFDTIVDRAVKTGSRGCAYASNGASRLRNMQCVRRQWSSHSPKN